MIHPMQFSDGGALRAALAADNTRPYNRELVEFCNWWYHDHLTAAQRRKYETSSDDIRDDMLQALDDEGLLLAWALFKMCGGEE